MRKVAVLGGAVILLALAAHGAITIDPPTRSFTKEGGGGSILTSGSGSWTANTAANWITITPRTNGVAGDSCIYVVGANFSADTRQGTISIGGQPHVVVQTGYEATITPSNVTYGISGGTGTVAVATSAGVSWSAATATPWLSVNTSSGTGNGSVGYSVDAYGGVLTRVGTITVAAKIFTVTQTGTDVNIAPAVVDRGNGSDIIQIAVTALVGTQWSVVPKNPWITIVDPGSGFGDSVITLAIGANPSYLLRTGSVTIGCATLDINQDGVATPSFDITPKSSTADPGGALGSVAVSATPDAPWSVQSQAPWILIPGPLNGSGNGNVNFVVSANPLIEDRLGTIDFTAPPSNPASRDFSRGLLHAFNGKADFARTAIEIVGGSAYPIFDGSSRAHLNDCASKDTDEWTLAFRFRPSSAGSINRLLQYSEGGRVLAFWLDTTSRLNVRVNTNGLSAAAVKIVAGESYFVLAAGTTNRVDVYICQSGSTPAKTCSVAVSASIFPKGADLTRIDLGGADYPSSGNFVGELAFLSFHSRVLSSAEIRGYRQSDPYNDVSDAASRSLWVMRNGSRIKPTRALMCRGNLKDQMGLGLARLMNGTNSMPTFTCTKDRFGLPSEALATEEARVALSNATFRAATFWIKPRATQNDTLLVLR